MTTDARVIDQPRVGEIIETSTAQFVVGCYELMQAPPFGSFVRAQTRQNSMQIYGLVSDIRTTSKEPGGRATVRGRTFAGELLYDDEIYRENPDLIQVLQTEFNVITIGYGEQGRIFQYLPPQPPPVHYSVYTCTTAEIAAFTASCDFFRTVLFGPQANGDELLSATIRLAAQQHPDPYVYLTQAGRELAALLKEDYDRLAGLLRRIRPTP